ncbi:hypothetical protein M9435_004675 [Picochlorum sp. BPE23]|nr:hypothetical protein M9435_004675 [Picochlorum sp. BPE23]
MRSSCYTMTLVRQGPVPLTQKYTTLNGFRGRFAMAIASRDENYTEEVTSRPLFADFIAAKSVQGGDADADDKVDELIERTSGVLRDAAEALQDIRSKYVDETPSVKRGDGGAVGVVKSRQRPAFLNTQRDTKDGFSGSSLAPPSSVGTSLDGWFGGKVDAGPLLAPKKEKQGPRMMFKEKDSETPQEMWFAGSPLAPEAPEESIKGSQSLFPESLALKFQSEDEEIYEEAMTVGLTEMTSTTESGEEFGENGYWYRWTEVSGQNKDGTVAWTERWWEVSDWSGMKELGAEKYGINDSGDAWRETWTEKISIDKKTKQPMVLRNAHKWARAANQQEWEEKWSEVYWSGGKTEKWADKWGRDGGDAWHETWGEDYDGFGGCVKWTDRWAERPDGYGGLTKWGDKWREEFKHGVGEKNGETWQEIPGQDKYQRWWGENHFGDGRVQKHGNSSTGEHWDVTEHMDTYYNPIPHFGYDLALAHSPQLREVPVLPRDDILDLEFES